jgi:two-component system phosphate regulon sensor histidine kinase PhoR
MKRRIPDPILMVITIIVIIGFQVYWLKDNYDREKRTMEIKAGAAFQETIQELQVAKLKLPDIFLRRTKSGKNERMLVNESTSAKRTREPIGSAETITTLVSTGKKTGKGDSNRSQMVFILQKDSNGNFKRTVPLRYIDSLSGEKEMFFQGTGKITRTTERRQIVTSINILRSKLNDSLRIDTFLKHASFRVKVPRDSAVTVKTIPVKRSQAADKEIVRMLSDSSNHALKVLYSVDSLQDSLKIPEITKAFSAALKKENLDIPFTVAKLHNVESGEEHELTDVTVGFVNPVTYRMSLNNTASYLFKKISLPMLFSLFLVGVTIFSFMLLYRNLLRQQKLAEIKNEFISNISHELKTPIATVGVAIEALKNFNAMHDPQKTKEYLDISSNELQRLGLLVDKVLKLSMFEKREVELSREQFDMKELTQEVLDTMKLQFEKNRAVVHFTIEGNSFMINADKLHITSVIYNLLDNALKYRSEAPEINVRLSADANNIELSVRDNGIGIEPEYQSKIFDKFFRVPTGNRHVVKGYGLGLSYVSHIIEEHKGTIQVESEINKGSTFIIKIPVNAKG